MLRARLKYLSELAAVLFNERGEFLLSIRNYQLPINFSDVTLLIVAGGKSSRMGQDKRLLEVGGVTLLERILMKAHKENFARRLLCVESSSSSGAPLAQCPGWGTAKQVERKIEATAGKYGAGIVTDKVAGAGPLGGLASGLSKMSTEWALAVSCDMPFFEFEAVKPLNVLKEEGKYQVVMYEHQPLAAFYHKSMSEVFSRALSLGQRKLQLAINEAKYAAKKLLKLPAAQRIEREPSLTQPAALFNVNRPEELRLAQGRNANLEREVPIVSVIAPKSGTGKTTFIERVIPKLTLQGLKVGCVKHTHHKLSEDETGKDSGRMKAAGAKFVKFDAQEIEPSVDVILVESRTFDVLPSLSLYRGLSEPLVSETVAALFTDRPLGIEGIVQHDLNDIEAAAEVIVFLCGR